ncbi:MAG: glycosyltransferase [Vicinamibacterales bacterium]
MRISVVIATKNRAGLLAITLDHLRRQQYAEGDEVIVVDNNSEDRTAAVVRDGAVGFPVPLHYLLELAPGKSRAVNAGVAGSTGDVLALTDDDVQPAGDWIAAIRDVFSDRALMLAGGRVDAWWEAPCPWWLRPCEPDAEYPVMFSPLALLHYGPTQPLGVRAAIGANLIVRREVFVELGGFAPHLGRTHGTLLCGEDHDFCDRAASANYRCEYRPEIRVRHWVPAARTRLRYYLRWFFWSGITNAILEGALARPGPHVARQPALTHMLRRLCGEAWQIAAAIATARPADSVAHLMEAAFAVGYLSAGARFWPRPHPPSATAERAGIGDAARSG